MYKLFLLLLLLPLCSFAQQTLTQSQLFALIRSNHPIAKQAALLQEKGNQEIIKAKGSFDPYVFTDLNQKQFGGKQYYSLFDMGVKVPLIYGPDIKIGYDQSQGLLLNPENSTPSAGLLYGGFSMPLAQGLLMDRRRATLQQAENFAKSTVVEQQRILNDLFFEAAEVYWQWTAAWNQVIVFENAIKLAQTRFDMTKQGLRLGDRAAIDTTEAYLQVQDRMFQLQQATLIYQNVSFILANFLWDAQQNPINIAENWQPLTIEKLIDEKKLSSESLKDIYNNLALAHPDLRMYSFKIKDLEIEKRWKKEKLKPKLNFNYNFLNYANKSPLYLFPNQYKWGFDFSIPIFLREAKGDLNLTKIKLLETQYQLDQKTLQIQNKIKSYENELLNLDNQIRLYDAMTENYQRLLNGEMKRFELGESSLFLVNAREVSLISAELKRIELKNKYQKGQAALRWAAGVIGEE